MGKRAIVDYLKLLTIIFTVIFAALTLYGLTGGNHSPIGHTFHACMVVLLPFFIIVDFIAFVYWAVCRRWWALVPLVPLICCWSYIHTIVQFRGATKEIPEQMLTVGSYNVKMFSGEAVGYIASDIMQAMSRENCDIVCLQEFRDEIPGDNSTVRARVRELYQYSIAGEGNMAIFSRYPIRDHREFKFAYSNNGWQWADIEITHDRVVRVFNVHMETTGINSALHQMAKENSDIDLEDLPMDPDAVENSEEQRNAFNSRVNNDRVYRLLLGNYAFGLSVRGGQSIEVANEMRMSDKPIILAGDFNDVPYSFTYKTLKGDLVDGFTTGGHGFSNTYRGAKGFFRIDYIFSDSQYPCFEYHTLDLTYSDHKPVIAKFEL